ncbi:c-type cytochrome [Campylobacter sp. 9BO]|uniref:c-type cytochrome n=1 Tax=Campylobacter sp. 9BO TaxID=3424759 RepID=UPI003D336115
MKIFATLSLACILGVSAFGASEVYYIRANGEFGKQLSEMAKNYAKDNNQKVDIFVDEDPRVYKDTRILKTGVDRKRGRYSVSLGKEIYDAKCASCHGEQAEKRVGGIKPLKDQSAEDIEDAMVSYRSNTEFGGSMRSVMQNIAKTASNNDLGAIIAYLKGKDAYINEQYEANKPVSTEKKQGSYLR